MPGPENILRKQVQPLSDECILPQTPLVSILLSFRLKRQLPPGEAAPFQKICRYTSASGSEREKGKYDKNDNENRWHDVRDV